jgi:hypothetical protein
MPTIDVSRPAQIVDGLIRQSYTYYNQDTGAIESKSFVLEDEQEKSVSRSILNSIDETIRDYVDTAIDETITDIVINNISANVDYVTEVLTDSNKLYTTSFPYVDDSISIFLNGINVTSDSTLQTDTTFILHNDYFPLNESDKVFVSYVKK